MYKELIVFIVAIAVNVTIARYQAWRFDIKQERINHGEWAFAYGLFCALTFLMTKNWLTVASCLTMHLPVFNPVLNLSRRPKRDLLYTDPLDPQGSWFVRVVGKFYIPVFLIDTILFIIIQLFIYV